MLLSNMITSPEYKYEDDDVKRILDIRLKQENLNNILILPPIYEVEKNLVQLLTEEKENQSPDRTLLIPYLIGFHGHWVGIVVRFDEEKVLKIEYYDSLVRDITETLVQDLKKVYGDDVNEKIASIKDNLVKQDDFFSCGPCMIENLINAAKQDFQTVEAIRRNHKIILDNYFPDRPTSSSKQVQEVNQGSSDHSSDDLIRKSCCYPRSEYRTRFKGTSAFRMKAPIYWNTYFRSAPWGGNCDRLAKFYNKTKVYTNDRTSKKQAGAAKAGTFRSPWSLEKYNEIFKEAPEKPQDTDKNNDNLLYDQLLEYKQGLCHLIVNKAQGIEKIKVYYKNDYPCVMVQVPDLHDKIEVRKVQGTRGLYKIVAAYFTAITNKKAYELRIPIELVNRASFGHNIPSVAETKTSFRINVGLVPEIYVTVLAMSLQSLNDFLSGLLSEEDPFKLNIEEAWRNEHNDNIKWYNELKYDKYTDKINSGESPRKVIGVEEWKADDDLFSVLTKTSDSIGNAVSFQITRMNLYIDLLTDYIKMADNDLAQPLRDILKKLDYSKGNATLDVQKKDFQTKLTSFCGKEHPDIASDRKFWKIIENMNSVFAKQNINELPISSHKIIGLYSMLERANLEFIKNSGYQNSCDGYGSDSDCDVSIEGEDNELFTFHSRKIIVSTGMRAINLAQVLTVYLTEKTEIDTSHMYYETADAIKMVKDIQQTLDLKRDKHKQKVIRYIDLTHCASEGPDSKAADLSVKKKEKILVLDYTSATTQRISEAIKLIHKIPVLLLVNSGIKNEQMGADMNPYGTLRIIAQKEDVLNELYFWLEAALHEREELPKHLHNIRKTYKDAGAVVTSAAIYTHKRGYVGYTPKSNTAERSENEGFTIPQKLKNIFDLFYRGELIREELRHLTNIHEQKISDVLHWNEEKIQCLGSSQVKLLVEYTYSVTFSQIKTEYEEEPQLTNKVISDIHDKNMKVFYDKNYKEVSLQYKLERKNRIEKLKSQGYSADAAEAEVDCINILDELLDEKPIRDSYEGELSFDESSLYSENESFSETLRAS